MNVLSENNTFKEDSNIHKLYESKYVVNVLEERKLMKKSERKTIITEKDYRSKLQEKAKILSKQIVGLYIDVVDFDYAKKMIPNITSRDPTILACAMFLHSVSEDEIEIDQLYLEELADVASNELNAKEENVKYDILRYYRVLYNIGG